MRTRSSTFLAASTLALFAMLLNMSAPGANASATSSKASSSHSSGSDHSSDSDSDECGDDSSASHDSSASIKNSSKSNSPVKDSSNYSHSDDGDDDDNCIEVGTPAEIAKRVPKTIGTPIISTCTTDAALTWSAVVSPGYAVVTSYRVRYSSNGGSTWTTYPTQTVATSLTLTGLTSGLTYIFQVAAQNANGWGSWSASTSGCTLTAVVGTVFSYIIDGFANVPTLPGTPACPTVELAFQDSTGPQGVSLCKLTPGGGTFVKNTYTYDFYVALPDRGTAYTFTVTGSNINPVSLGVASALGAGHPTYFSTDSVYFSQFVVYGFKITTGSTLTITIN